MPEHFVARFLKGDNAEDEESLYSQWACWHLSVVLRDSQRAKALKKIYPIILNKPIDT